MADDRPWLKDVPHCDFSSDGICIARVYEACQCKTAEYQLAKLAEKRWKNEKTD